ncbi:glycosyl hydrolase family 18 protein [Micromonospora sp. NPDC049102]|uniref:glycosyl hydrolase family 18 protein n=1 Tax=Micromonospora sp. NPDC049102 TaxID=3364265 RepID=UPI003716AEEA
MSLLILFDPSWECRCVNCVTAASPLSSPWLFDGTTLWTYDDPAVVLQKTLYIRRAGLGGAMIWSLDGDDDNATLTRTIGLGLGLTTW